jgi:thiol-disulfide isomerase/thioredoxin
LISDYKTLGPEAKYLAKLEEVYLLKSKLVKGKPAIGFTYPGLDGKNVSLADLKGKYVYIDLWASWCGPCKRELPYSQKMVEKFKNKNIAFVFISIDEDETAWRNAVKKENLSGINLLAKEGFNAEIMKAYGVRGIPHYLLIDAEGNIISSNAMRPSGGIEQELEKLLK